MRPYLRTRSAAPADCESCAPDEEISVPHAHEYFVQREGGNARTADDLAVTFVEDVEDLLGVDLGAEQLRGLLHDEVGAGCYWAVDADAAETIRDAVWHRAEPALYEAGYQVDWEDGYVVSRISYQCAECGEPINWVREEHWQGWESVAGGQLSYVPTLHEHRP